MIAKAAVPTLLPDLDVRGLHNPRTFLYDYTDMNEQRELIALFRPFGVVAWCGRDIRRGFAVSAASVDDVIDTLAASAAASGLSGQHDLAAALNAVAADIARTGEHFALQIDDTYYSIIPSQTSDGWDFGACDASGPPLTVSAPRKEAAYLKLVLGLLERHEVATHV